MPVKKTTMLWKVLAAIVLAIIVGNFTGTTAGVFGVTFYELFDLLGQLFLNALTILLVPLVAGAIIYSLGQIGGDESFGRLGMKTFFFYILTTLLAILTGLILVNIIEPGKLQGAPRLGTELTANMPASDHPFLGEEHEVSTDRVILPVDNVQAISQIMLKIIPVNLFAAAAQGNMLGVIFFSLLFGYALSRIESQASTTMLNFWKGVFYTLMKMTHLIMKAMPLGVFFLVAKVVAAGGMQSVKSVAYFFLTVLLGLIIYMLIILPILLKIKGISPIKHYKAMAPALITAFSTSSSAASLPVTIDCVEKRAGVSNRICSFVVPLGTSVNMSGSALYECVAALFIAQLYGIDLSFVQQFIIVILSLLTSMGMAGIPSASLVAIIVILNTMGLPAEGIALILPVDRILDMCRTTANVFSDASCAVLVARSEGEQILSTRSLKAVLTRK